MNLHYKSTIYHSTGLKDPAQPLAPRAEEIQKLVKQAREERQRQLAKEQP